MSILFASKYRQIIRDKTQCPCHAYKFNDIPIVSDTTAAAAAAAADVEPILPTEQSPSAAIGDPAKDSIPGNKQTQVARLVDLVRYTRGGRIFYGDDPTLYSAYNMQPLPIIDGLRGGIVPASMRKNNF
jgi:hypothetical protein